MLLPKESRSGGEVTIKSRPVAPSSLPRARRAPWEDGRCAGLWLTIVDSPRTLVALDLMEPAVVPGVGAFLCAVMLACVVQVLE